MSEIVYPMSQWLISKDEKIAELRSTVAAKDAEIAALQQRLAAVEHSVRVGADVDHERDYLAMEARRYASHYPEASDGRNTFVMFAEMIEARSALSPLNSALETEGVK